MTALCLFPIIFKPTTRLAFFRFKRQASEVEDELRKYISERNQDILTSQELIVKARNQVSTLADRSGAGRVERKDDKDERIAAVARQDGFGGRMLQTKLLGDILSTVEYTANEKREMIANGDSGDLLSSCGSRSWLLVFWSEPCLVFCLV